MSPCRPDPLPSEAAEVTLTPATLRALDGPVACLALSSFPPLDCCCSQSHQLLSAS